MAVRHVVLAFCVAVALVALGADAAGRGLPPAASSAPAAANSGPSGRQLLQSTSCTEIPNCAQCRQATVANATKISCSKCGVGYVLKFNACWCAAGYYKTAPNECSPCGVGYICPGAKNNEAEGEARIQCGRFKTTRTDKGAIERDCVSLPGYGWAPGDGSTPCEIGTYSSGMTNRRCSKCAAGMTTRNVGSTLAADCIALPGYYSSRGRGVPCEQGTFKPDTSNAASCQRCPEGFTTRVNTTGATSANQCSFVMPGYGAAPGATIGVTAATACPPGSYQTGTVPYSAAAGVPCVQCPLNMQTADPGSTSSEDCLPPPGYGFNETTGTAYPCPVGSYSEGWELAPCLRCGGADSTGITTRAAASTGAYACMVPPGHYTVLSGANNETISALPCPLGTFGRDGPYFQIEEPLECSTCLEGSNTTTIGATNSSACRVNPGYGYEDGDIVICDFGYYSAGGDLKPCTPCGAGYNTTRGGNLSEAVQGATRPQDCVVAAGWTTDGAGGLKPCPAGSYKSALGGGGCSACPAGTTTSGTASAAAASDCDACLPGFGASAIDPTAPACQLCPSGTFSPGGAPGGAPCQICPPREGYSGRIVSKRGSTNPDGCIPEFDPLPVSETWDYIPMSTETLASNPAATASDCEAACVASDDCLYYIFKASESVGAQCALRSRVDASPVNLADNTKSYVLIEVSGGFYTSFQAHPTDAVSLGDLLGAFATVAEAAAACSAAAKCVGVKFVHTDATISGGGLPWRTFQGRLQEGAVAKVRAVGESINPWIIDPLAG